MGCWSGGKYWSESRTTLYRWRTGKSRPRYWLNPHRGRKPVSHKRDRFDLQYAAALIDERRRTKYVDYILVRHEMNARKRREEVRQIFRKLLLMRQAGWPPNLIKTACCSSLRIGPRRRGWGRRELDEHFWARSEGNIPHMVKRLMSAANLDQKTAEDLLNKARESGVFEWVTEVLKDSALVRPDAGISKICVSKVFPAVSRRMASYYRCRNRDAFHEMESVLLELAKGWKSFPPDQPPTPLTFMPSAKSRKRPSPKML
jgi:hypothetical protein